MVDIVLGVCTVVGTAASIISLVLYFIEKNEKEPSSPRWFNF